METSKINFFAKVKKAIFNFDEYELFITEPLKKAFSYFFKMIFIFSLIITIALVIKIRNDAIKVAEIINKEFPNFKIENNELQTENEEDFEYYFENNGFGVKIRNDNYVINEEDNTLNGIILFKDKCILKLNGTMQEIPYEKILSDDITSKDIIDIIGKQNKILIYMFLIILLISFMCYTVIIFFDIITLSILGLIINLIIRTSFKYKELLKISIYSMTLPVILYIIYITLNIALGVTIKYFEIAYDTIAYVYLITVLLMMKSDAIKNTQELQKIMEEEKKVKEELERQRQEEKEKQEEANKDKEKKKKKEKKEEPDGEPQTEN